MKLALSVGLVLVLLLMGAVVGERYSYCEKYSERSLLGLTRAEVIERIGEPLHGAEEGVPWTFQSGTDPDAVLYFNGGRVSSVTLLRHQRCPIGWV